MALFLNGLLYRDSVLLLKGRLRRGSPLLQHNFRYNGVNSGLLLGSGIVCILDFSGCFRTKIGYIPLSVVPDCIVLAFPLIMDADGKTDFRKFFP